MSFDFKSVSNFRDVSINNMSRGKLFRSAKLSNLNDLEKKKLDNLNLYKIIDFRDPKEIRKSPDNLSKDLKDNYINLSISAKTLSRMIDARQKFKDDKIFYEKVMEESYKLYIENHKDVWRSFFNILIAAKGMPIIFHCTAGKDRTGVASYLIQSLCGADQSLIDQNYLLSNDMLSSREAVSEQKDTLIHSDNLVTPLMLLTLGKVKISYLNSAREIIKNKYKSVKNYFLTELGFKTEHLNKLLTIYK